MYILIGRERKYCDKRGLRERLEETKHDIEPHAEILAVFTGMNHAVHFPHKQENAIKASRSSAVIVSKANAVLLITCL